MNLMNLMLYLLKKKRINNINKFIFINNVIDPEIIKKYLCMPAGKRAILRIIQHH